ncbi:hypothetical protein CBNA_0680 [Coxiella burnetii str. Namibia]|nr:hypothetical protein CBNA_0680 [Coxiella burnetii str. Namibia]
MRDIHSLPSLIHKGSLKKILEQIYKNSKSYCH